MVNSIFVFFSQKFFVFSEKVNKNHYLNLQILIQTQTPNTLLVIMVHCGVQQKETREQDPAIWERWNLQDFALWKFPHSNSRGQCHPQREKRDKRQNYNIY